MSVNAMNWAGLCRVAGAGGAARAVLDAVAWFAADAGDPNAARAWPPVEVPEGHAACWRGAEQIAERAEVNVSTVKTVLARLERAGVLARRRRHRRDGDVSRRTSDVLLLDLTAEPVLLPRDPKVSAQRAAAGRAGARAAAAARDGLRWPTATLVAESEVAVGHLSSSGPGQGREVAPSRGQGGSEPGAKVAVGHGVVQDTHHDRRQDTGLSPKPGTSPGLGMSPVDRPGRVRDENGSTAAPDDPDADQTDHADQLAAAAATLGDRKDRKLPTGNAWTPLRRLSGPAYDGLVDRILGDLVTGGQLAEDWPTGTSGQLADVWRRVRAAMLRDLTSAAASPDPPPARRHEEVA